MSRKLVAPVDDNPEWTADDFARARPLSDFPELAGAFPNTRGRPAGTTRSDRKQVTLRLPSDVIAYFKQDGPGWQTRAVDALVKVARKGR